MAHRLYRAPCARSHRASSLWFVNTRPAHTTLVAFVEALIGPSSTVLVAPNANAAARHGAATTTAKMRHRTPAARRLAQRRSLPDGADRPSQGPNREESPVLWQTCTHLDRGLPNMRARRRMMLSTGHTAAHRPRSKLEMKTVKVLIADDHRLMLTGVRRALDDADDIEVVDEVSSGTQVLPAVARTEPDVLLLDIRMPGTSGSRPRSGSAAATRTCA